MTERDASYSSKTLIIFFIKVHSQDELLDGPKGVIVPGFGRFMHL